MSLLRKPDSAGMDWDGKVRSAGHACSASGRALAPGERCWSALVLAEDGFVRRDYSEDAWASVDRQGLVSCWRWKVPERHDARQRLRLDDDMLRRLFTDLAQRDDRPSHCLRYVIGLCLVRNRAFLWLGEQAGTISLENKLDRSRHALVDPGMLPEDLANVTQALQALVGGVVVDAPATASPASGSCP